MASGSSEMNEPNQHQPQAITERGPEGGMAVLPPLGILKTDAYRLPRAGLRHIHRGPTRVGEVGRIGSIVARSCTTKCGDSNST